MKRNIIFLGIILISDILLILCNQNNESKFHQLKGPYLGQKPPGMTPEIFAPGIVSTVEHGEYGGHFSPDGKMFIFTRRVEGQPGRLYFSEYKENKWTIPEVVPFGYETNDSQPCFFADGKRLIFVSGRPEPNKTEDGEHHNFWVVDYDGSGWGKPYLLDPDINLGERRVCPSVSKNGNLYFSGNYKKPGDKDIFLSRLVNGKYTEPENLGSSINTNYYEQHVFIAQDESYILFDSYRPAGYEKSNIYISYRKEDNSWTEAKILSEAVNSEQYDWYPVVTPDEKYILFTRTGYGEMDIYWVSVKIFEKLKPDNLK